MRPHAVQTFKGDGDGLRRCGRSVVRQRAAVVQAAVLGHAADGPGATVRHVLRHVQRVHRDHRHQLRAGAQPLRAGLHPAAPGVHRRAARAAHPAQLRAQPQVTGSRVPGGQRADGRRPGHHFSLSGVRRKSTVHLGQATSGIADHLPVVLLLNRVRHGGHRSGECAKHYCFLI